MKQKTTLILIIILVVIILGITAFFIRSRNFTSEPESNLLNLKKEARPSETFIEYADPAGFNFSYPDNLSISKAEIEDPNVYTDLELFSKDVNGSVKLKISDTKIATLSAWLKENNIPESNKPQAKKLGSLDALEIKTNDRLMLGALDQGVLFTVEMPLLEQDFWIKVYDKVISGFTFALPAANESSGISTSSESDVVFEGEEVVE